MAVGWVRDGGGDAGDVGGGVEMAWRQVKCCSESAFLAVVRFVLSSQPVILKLLLVSHLSHRHVAWVTFDDAPIPPTVSTSLFPQALLLGPLPRKR